MEESLVTFFATVFAIGFIRSSSPARAISIALRSRFAFKPKHQSHRYSEINLLKRQLAEKDFGQSYLVVTGESGLGKSCLIDTVTNKMPGVIQVSVFPECNQDKIIENTLKELARPSPFRHSLFKAERVIFWYRLFTLGRSPIVVMKVSEREPRQGHASITGAVRTLVEDYKLRVVVDGTPNSLNVSLFRTMREQVIELDPLNKGMIWDIEQLKDLFKYIKQAGLDDTVFAVLGGVPLNYEHLWRSTKFGLQNGLDARKEIGAHLCECILDAIWLVSNSHLRSNDMREIIELYRKSEIFTYSTIHKNQLQRPSDDMIFREVERDGASVLVPASNAIEIVLKHNLKKRPTFAELEELLRAMK